MLSNDQIEQVQRLVLAGQLSQRDIARAAGISRSSVAAIAAGRRGATARPEPPDPYLVLGAIERCTGCGGRVHMPCRLCRTRAFKADRSAYLQQLRAESRRQAGERLLRKVRAAYRARLAREGRADAAEPQDSPVLDDPAATTPRSAITSRPAQ